MLLNQAGYAPFGPATGWVYGNGRTLSRSHTRNYQAETIQDNASGGLSLHYGYDAAGQLTELKDGLQSAFLARYDYDNLGRLTILRDGPSSTPIETYTYDATGNRTSLLHGGITTSFTYPGSNHRLSSAGGVARSYDGVGNTTAIGGTAKQFNYGEDDRMNSVSQNGTMLRSYAYNALGERVLSTIPAVAGNPDGSGGTPAVNTYTVYDESGRWLGDYDHNGAVLQQAIWLDDLPVGLLAGTGANQKLHYIEPDHLGTPRAVIDRSRDVAIWTWALQGEAFGNSAPNQDPDLDSTTFVLDMRFPGQRYDAATGLNYNYFRDYDAGSGRYVQSDPIGLEGGLGTYVYVDGRPLSAVDPSGLAIFARPITFRVRPPTGPGTLIGKQHPWFSQPQLRIAPRGGKPKNNIPSWARGTSPTNSETPIEYAYRVCRDAGMEPGKGPKSNLNQLKKYAETHFKPDGSPPSALDMIIFRLFDNSESPPPPTHSDIT